MTKLQGLPTGSDYAEAVQHPERCFSDPDLKSASFERMPMGLPRMISGNFASVFPVTSAAGHKYAVKCFTRHESHQLERYKRISAQLEKLKPWWATDFQFVPEGIHVDGARYPILRMNWVQGLTLTRWVSDNVYKPAAVANLSDRFEELARDLAASGMAHGDLQAGNLLVADDGRLHLVDYDGMYVPGLDGLPPDEVGHPDYQPPGRSQHDYGPAMDRFSAWLISLSLKILAAAPELWDQLNPAHDEYLLLNRNDLHDLGSSPRLSALCSHHNAEVRRLAQIMRQVLSLPVAAIPILAAPSPNGSRSPKAPPDTGSRGIPGWMRSHLPEPADPPAESGAQSAPGQSQHGGRRLTWLVRILVLLPLTALAGAGDWPLSLTVFAAAIFLVAITLWVGYLCSPLNRAFAETKRARRKAVADTRRAAARISRAEKEAAGADRARERMANRQAKEQASLSADFDRRQKKESYEIGSIDRQLTQLGDRKKRETRRYLRRYQQNFIRSRLSLIELNANDVSGVGAQLVTKLHAAGIRSAADFVGVGFVSNGRSANVYFRLTSGQRAHVPGIGRVKAERIDQWRRTQVARATVFQPSALPASELSVIDARFLAEERQLREQRTRATQQIADQIAVIKQELNAALTEMEKRHQDELMSFDQRRSALAAQLGQAHAAHLAARQQVLTWDNRVASAARPTFGRFVSAAIRGREPGGAS